jgi:hypothetical protein
MTEVFAADQPPLPASQDLVRHIQIDTWTGLQASEACKDLSEDENVLNVTDPWAREWLRGGEGRAWLEQHDMPRKPFFAPERECRADDPRPMIKLNLQDNQDVNTPALEIKGTADATGLFESWRLEYVTAAQPDNWIMLNQSNNPVRDATLYLWDLSTMPNGVVAVRLTVTGVNGEVQRDAKLNINLPVTPTVTPFPTDTPVILPSETPVPSETSIPPEVPTETPTLQP